MVDSIAREVDGILSVMSPRDGDLIVLRVPDESPYGLERIQEVLVEVRKKIKAKVVFVLLNGDHDLQHIPHHKAVELLDKLVKARGDHREDQDSTPDPNRRA